MNLSKYAVEQGLTRVGERPSLGRYIKEVWRRRVFVTTLARSRMQAKNQQNRFGMAWLIMTPLLDALVYGTVFGLLQGDKRPEHFILFLLIGIFFFRFFSDCVSTGARSVINNQALVQTLSFPRMVLPLAIVVEHFLNFLPVLAILLLFSIPLGAEFSLKWFYLLPVVVLTVMFNTGVVLFFARVAVHFRDISQIIPFINRVMRYFSGVFFSPLAFVGSMPLVMAFFTLNPVYVLLELARYALIPNYEVSVAIVISALVWSIGGFIAGSLFFWAAEEKYGRSA